MPGIGFTFRVKEDKGTRKGSSGGSKLATYIALLQQGSVIPTVVEQSLLCVSDVTVKAEIDVGIHLYTFKFPYVHNYAY